MCCFACRLLVRLCNEGRRVVRLKGGCCSVFSRVHSELSALRSAGCDVTMGATHPACPPLLSLAVLAALRCEMGRLRRAKLLVTSSST